MRVDYPRQAHDGVRRFIPSFKQLLALGLLGFLLLFAAASVAYARTDIPTPNEMISAQTSIVYYDDGKTEIGRFGSQNRINVTIDQVPEHVQHAVLAAEDRSFYENRGISPSGIGRAAWNNLRGESTQGGSTITQQYAKNAYLTQERTYTRKFKEFFIAVKLAQRDDKNKILQDYLNTIYFGRGAYGIQTASQTYFGKDVDKLSVEEGAVLASIIRSPARYDPANHPDALAGRFEYVLDGMVDKGWLAASDRAGMKLPKIPEVTKKEVKQGGTTYYLMDTVRRELKSKGFTDQEIDFGGLRVTTTFDRKAQRSAVRAVRSERPREGAKGVHIGLSAVRPGTGAVVAMYGGDRAGENNEATQARVMPGSAFKPFALAGAVDDGISIKSRFTGNGPLELPGTNKEVNNEFDRDYGENVDLIKATEESINTAYVDLTLEMGAKKVVNAAVAAGIPEDTPGLIANATITLGTASVRNIDMANAYATFAAKGQTTSWFVVKEVKTSTGGTRYRAKVQRERAFPEDVSADVSYAMQQVVQNGTGTEARNLDRPAAGKTGTAAVEDDTRSAWFVGYTPQLSAAVDFYRGDGTGDLDGAGGLETFFGGAYPARVWTAFMKGALEGTKVLDFPEPEYVGEDVNPKPTFTPRPTTPRPTPTTAPPTTKTPGPPTTKTPGPPTTPKPTKTPPGQVTPTPKTTITLPGTGPPQ